MKHTSLPLENLVLIEPTVHTDERGWFLESWNQRDYAGSGVPDRFVQDNLARSTKGVLRGLHYQFPRLQGKLVSVASGVVFDVAVDIRRKSTTFGQWYGVELSAENHRRFYIPEGFAHGYCVLSEEAVSCYKCTEFYHPGDDRGLAWNDPQLGIDWPVTDPILSEKDKNLPVLSRIDLSELPS